MVWICVYYITPPALVYQVIRICSLIINATETSDSFAHQYLFIHHAFLH